jgi:predicted phosphodiesterase
MAKKRPFLPISYHFLSGNLHSAPKPYRIRIAMKTLIFSDSHLGLPFEEKKYKFIEGIIKPVDKVIINGDFWEGFFMNFSQFVESPWKNLFPLLKQKHAVYIFGNHDEEEMSDERVSLFSTEQRDKIELKINDKTLIVEHGHRHAFLQNFDNRFISKHSIRFEKVMTRKTGNRFHKLLGIRLNKKIKKALQDQLKKDEIYICGHTHYAEMDKDYQFINSGIVDYGLGQYLMVENDRIVAKEEWYD